MPRVAAHVLNITNSGRSIKIVNFLLINHKKSGSSEQNNEEASHSTERGRNYVVQSSTAQCNQPAIMSPAEPSPALRKWLHQHHLTGYLRVLATDPWADLEAVYATIDVADITPEAVRASLDLPPGGIKDVEMLNHDSISAYYGEFSATSKSYKTLGGHSDMFKE